MFKELKELKKKRRKNDPFMSILPKKIYSLFKSWFNFLAIICKSQMKGKIYYISPSIYFLVFSPYYYHRVRKERERKNYCDQSTIRFQRFNKF